MGHFLLLLLLLFFHPGLFLNASCKMSRFPRHLPLINKVMKYCTEARTNVKNVIFFFLSPLRSRECLSLSSTFKLCHLIFPKQRPLGKQWRVNRRCMAKAAALYKLSIFYSKRQAHLSLTRPFPGASGEE